MTDFISYSLCSMLDSILNKVEMCTFLSHNCPKKGNELRRLLRTRQIPEIFARNNKTKQDLLFQM